MFGNLSAAMLILTTSHVTAANLQLPLLNDPVDISGDFRDFSDTYFLADKLADFDPGTASGKITFQRGGFTANSVAAMDKNPNLNPKIEF